MSEAENEKDKRDIIESESKLQQLAYVDFVKNLPEKTQQMLAGHKYFIPWIVVWKSNSFGTPCRIVFDASAATPSGYSLNDILAKGKNNLNRLQEMLIK